MTVLSIFIYRSKQIVDLDYDMEVIAQLSQYYIFFYRSEQIVDLTTNDYDVEVIAQLSQYYVFYIELNRLSTSLQLIRVLTSYFCQMLKLPQAVNM